MKFAHAITVFGLALSPALAGPAGAVSVTRADDLSFGAVLAAGGGTVSVPASSAPPTATGGVLLSGAQFPQGGAASFDVANDTASTQTYALSLQSQPSDLGSAGLALSNFVLSQTSVMLAPGQSQRIYVGATLTLAGGPSAAGPYTAGVALTLLAQ